MTLTCWHSTNYSSHLWKTWVGCNVGDRPTPTFLCFLLLFSSSCLKFSLLQTCDLPSRTCIRNRDFKLFETLSFQLGIGKFLEKKKRIIMWAVEWPCDRDGPILNRTSASAQPHRRTWESGAGVEADGYQYKVSPTSVSHKLLFYFYLTFSSINNGIDLLLPSVLFATPRMMMMMMMTVLEVREGRNRDSINQSLMFFCMGNWCREGGFHSCPWPWHG